MVKQALVDYRRRNGRVLLRLAVLIPATEDDVASWRRRAHNTARIVGELHFALYDLESKESPDG